jgi:hypothetical protein
MNTPKKMNQEAEQGPIFDPFPKPQTMPSGWDLSGFESTPSQPTVSEPSFDAES